MLQKWPAKPKKIKKVITSGEAITKLAAIYATKNCSAASSIYKKESKKMTQTLYIEKGAES